VPTLGHPISGVVKDSGSAVLPGVIVEASKQPLVGLVWVEAAFDQYRKSGFEG
jgi:hypothetical protein